MKWVGLQKVKKEQIVVVFVIGLLLLVITIPTKERDTSTQKEEKYISFGESTEEMSDGEDISTDWQQASMEYTAILEEQLKACLEQVEGVGKVQVMITLKSSSEQVLAKDKTVASSSENTEGELEANANSESTETTVFEELNDTLIPYVIKELSPVVKGVFVVAEGGDNPVVKQNISDAVMALFSLESHKIMVVKMKEG